MVSAKKKGTTRGEQPTSIDKHKIWLVAGIGLAAVFVLVIVLYSSRKAVFGKVVEIQDSSQVLGRTDSLSDSLLAYYDFNSATEIGNELINNVDGTCGSIVNTEVPCPMAYIDSERGSVARFTDDLLAILSDDFLRLSQDYTIMFWIRAPNPSSGGTVLYGYGNTESGSPLLIELTPVVSSPNFAIKVKRPEDLASAVVESRDIIPQGEWVHVALVVDHYPTPTDQDNPFHWNVKLYVQGTEVDHIDGTTYNMDVSWGIIGARAGGTGSGFEEELRAWLDDLKIFTDDLIPAEIRSQGEIRELLCKNSDDDDVDGHVDCTDADCNAREGSALGNLCEYQQERSCIDGFDNDADSRVDCNDNDCTATCAAYSLAQQRASALAQIKIGQVQFDQQLLNAGERILAADRTRLGTAVQVCADASRAGIRASTATSASISTALTRGLTCFNTRTAEFYFADSAAAGCSNLVDDDRDVLVDCGDGDCGAVQVCSVTTVVENTAAFCSDRVDNDGDLQIDCEDMDCNRQEVCTTIEMEESCLPAGNVVDDGILDSNDIFALTFVLVAIDDESCGANAQASCEIDTGFYACDNGIISETEIASCVNTVCTPVGDVVDDGILDSNDVFALTFVFIAIDDDSCGAAGQASCEIDEGFHACDNGIISETEIASCTGG